MQTIKSYDDLRATISSYCNALPDQFSLLFDLLRYGTFSSANPKDVVLNLHEEVHRMAGAAHCMGYRDLGKELHQIERKLEHSLKSRESEMKAVLDDIAFDITQSALIAGRIRPEDSRVLQIGLDPEEGYNGPPLPTAQEREAMLGTKRIVYADDDRFTRDMMTTTLHSFGIRDLLCLSSGLEVLKLTHAYQPDLIIADWNMQPVNGYELMECVRQGGTSLPPDTPMIIFTSRKDRESKLTAIQNGADRLLRKPVSPGVLCGAILYVMSLSSEKLKLSAN